jgi:thiol-disulfide isomerase/thioredoxin
MLSSKLNKWMRGAAVAAALAITSTVGASAAMAPSFALPSRSGDTVSLAQLKGKVVMLNFWASWCGPCRQEMPLLDELYGKYQRAGLVMLSVNIDENAAPAIEMVQTLRISYPVLFDTRKEVSRAYDVSAMPVTVLVDRAGVVRYVSEGYKPGYEKRYTEKLRELLNE